MNELMSSDDLSMISAFYEGAEVEKALSLCFSAESAGAWKCVGKLAVKGASALFSTNRCTRLSLASVFTAMDYCTEKGYAYCLIHNHVSNSILSQSDEASLKKLYSHAVRTKAKALLFGVYDMANRELHVIQYDFGSGREKTGDFQLACPTVQGEEVAC